MAIVRLTPWERRVLTRIRYLTTLRGRPPTYSEVALRWSRSSVRTAVMQLRDKGVEVSIVRKGEENV